MPLPCTPLIIEMNFESNYREWEGPFSRLQFDLPDRLIARYPAQKRDEARLLVAFRDTGEIIDTRVKNISSFLHSGDLLIRNNTRVSARRVPLKRSTGGQLEATFLHAAPGTPSTWICLMKGAGKLKDGEILYYGENSPLSSVGFVYRGRPAAGSKESILRAIDLTTGSDSLALDAWPDIEKSEEFFNTYGFMPIPPYLGRKSDHADRVRYQTIYAAGSGSVAAPTAGLHFTPELEQSLHRKGVNFADLELVIGYGTFAPLSTENFRKKRLHEEQYFLPSKTANLLNTCFTGKKIAVGTTTLRALETEYRKTGGIYVEANDITDIFIHPPDTVQSINGLMTNFHLPGSSLILLVASFTGIDLTERIYKHAVDNEYRFYSYGDTMLIL